MSPNPINRLKDEYEYTKKDVCISLAKRDIIDNIYRSVTLEGISTTFLDTEKIYNDTSVNGYKSSEILTIINLKHAWWFLFNSIDESVSYNYICRVHKYVSNMFYHPSGYIRTLPVRIGGTSWTPSMPVEDTIKEDINELLAINDITDRALSMMCYLMRTQMFIDGNKRTSMLIANKILISNSIGVLSIPIENIDEFKILTIQMYEDGNYTYLKEFLIGKCIQFI